MIEESDLVTHFSERRVTFVAVNKIHKFYTCILMGLRVHGELLEGEWLHSIGKS